MFVYVIIQQVITYSNLSTYEDFFFGTSFSTEVFSLLYSRLLSMDRFNKLSLLTLIYQHMKTSSLALLSLRKYFLCYTLDYYLWRGSTSSLQSLVPSLYAPELSSSTKTNTFLVFFPLAKFCCLVAIQQLAYSYLCIIV